LQKLIPHPEHSVLIIFSDRQWNLDHRVYTRIQNPGDVNIEISSAGSLFTSTAGQNSLIASHVCSKVIAILFGYLSLSADFRQEDSFDAFAELAVIHRSSIVPARDLLLPLSRATGEASTVKAVRGALAPLHQLSTGPPYRQAAMPAAASAR
jgi:hypothetical protein